jgi:YD repeat-containing protein
MAGTREMLPQTAAHIFDADLTLGLFDYRKTDFHFDGPYPLQFTRHYRNQDERSRSFGIGTNDSMDIFLIGEMGRYIDLLFEGGGRLHFVHVPAAAGQAGDTYQGERSGGNPFSEARAVFAAGVWTLERRDGWKFFFPYRPRFLGANVTVLTGFSDPSGHKYEMVRNDTGDLLSVTTPSSEWLHFEPDENHRFRSITASSGRTVTYDYDEAGRLIHTVDSDGYEERFTYDDKAQMLSVTLGADAPLLVNTYDISGHIVTQTMADVGKFEYHYVRAPGVRGNALVPDVITAPNGLLTHFRYYDNGYTQSLPMAPPH